MLDTADAQQIEYRFETEIAHRNHRAIATVAGSCARCKVVGEQTTLVPELSEYLDLIGKIVEAVLAGGMINMRMPGDDDVPCIV